MKLISEFTERELIAELFRRHPAVLLMALHVSEKNVMQTEFSSKGCPEALRQLTALGDRRIEAITQAENNLFAKRVAQRLESPDGEVTMEGDVTGDGGVNA
jgi:hypothetical protein